MTSHLLPLLLLSSCSKTAIDEGTCGDGEEEMFNTCLSYGCSASYANSASGLDECDASGSALTQSGAGSCAFSGEGSCVVICDCDDSEPGDGSDPADVDDDGDTYTENDGDCDDGDASVHPGADELCNDVDDDCDDSLDEEATDVSTWYMDGDGDEYGDEDAALQSCDQPDDYVAEGGDCDDGDGSRHPGAEEVCDGDDEDCDEQIDEGTPGEVTWYADEDEDDYGDPESTQEACEAPEGHVADDSDCDDGDVAVNPDAIEQCLDGLDNDCDGLKDRCLLSGAAVRVDGVNNGDGAGGQVLGDVDLNRDGRPDLIVSASGADGAAGVDVGAVYVFYSPVTSSTGLEEADWIIEGASAGALAGGAIAGLGDVDGDGIGDLLVGARDEPRDDIEPGAAYIVSGGGVGVTSLADAYAIWWGALGVGNAGTAVVGLGDVDGDGVPDLVVGDNYNSDEGRDYTGVAYLVLGPTPGVFDLEDDALRFVGEQPDSEAGSSLAAPGDLDGDGDDELLIGAYRYNASTTLTGAVYVIEGPVTSGMDLSDAHATLYGPAQSLTGGSLAAAGDISGDGYRDLLIGAYRDDEGGTEAGAAFLLLGGSVADLDLDDYEAKLVGEGAGDYAGTRGRGHGPRRGRGARSDGVVDRGGAQGRRRQRLPLLRPGERADRPLRGGRPPLR